METNSSQSPHNNKPLLLIDILCFFVFVGFFVFSFKFGIKPESFTKGPTAIMYGIHSQFWGILFLLCYFFPDRSWILQRITWLCKNDRGFMGKNMAFVYFGFLFVGGTIVLLVGLGII
jgi:hypothetical protein